MVIDTHCQRSRFPRLGLAASNPRTLAIVGFMLLALALRVLIVRGSGVWADEAQFLWIVRFPSLAAMIDFLRINESHPPLFYFIMRGWLAALGDTEVAALALPIAFGVALVPAVYIVGERTLGWRTGLIAAALAATSPSLALHSGLARPYSLLPLLCLASVYTLWCGLCHGRTGSWIAHALSTLAMLLTHNWAWLVLGAEWLAAAAWVAAGRGGRGVKPVRGWVFTQVAIMVGFSPWLPTLLYQSRHAGHGPGARAPLEALGLFVTATTSLPLVAAILVGLAIIGAAIWGATRESGAGAASDKDRQLAILLFLIVPFGAFAAAAVLSAANFLLLPRCLVTVAPCLLLAMANGIASAPAMPRGVIVGTLFVGYLASSIALFGHVKSNAREVAPMVAAQARPTDLVLVDPIAYISSFEYYFKNGPQRIALAPSGENAGATCYNDLEERLRDPEAIKCLREKLVRAHDEGRRIWLVTERKIPSDDVPDGDRLPLLPGRMIIPTRTNQIRKHLNRLYGAPNTHAVPVDNREGWEILHVFLYSKDDPGTGPGSTKGLGRPAAP